MKKLLLIVIITLMSVSAFSQGGQSVRRLEVYNNTNCEQYFVVYGGDECDCETQNYHSAFIKIAPMSTGVFDSVVLANPTTGVGATFYTGASNEFISGVRLADNHHFESSCGFTWGCTLSQPGCGAPPLYVNCWPSPGYIVKDLNCEDCGWTIPTWIPDACGGTAKLVFN